MWGQPNPRICALRLPGMTGTYFNGGIKSYKRAHRLQRWIHREMHGDHANLRMKKLLNLAPFG